MAQTVRIAYPFLLEHLIGDDVVVNPMFGGHAVYADAKLCLFLLRRERPVLPREVGAEQNGVYVAATVENAEKLAEVFAEAKVQQLKGNKAWIFISESSENFEAYSVEACTLIATRDARIGR